MQASPPPHHAATAYNHTKHSRHYHCAKWRPQVYLVLYFGSNVLLTLHNKWIIALLGFNFPWIITAVHIGLSGAGSAAIYKCLYAPHAKKSPSPPAASPTGDAIRLYAFSILYTFSIAVSTLSMARVSLSFHQLVRSATPALTVALEWLFQDRQHSPQTYLSLLPVIVGIVLATLGEKISFSAGGAALTALGALLSAAKTIASNSLMAADPSATAAAAGRGQLHPLQLIAKMSIPALVQCTLWAWLAGELDEIQRFTFTVPITGKLLVNAVLALFLNWASFTANQLNGPLSMTVAGNVKQAIMLGLAVYLFDGGAKDASALRIAGIVLVVAGGVWYSAAKWRERALFKLLP